MAEFSTLSAVDLGSNSFRLELGRVVDNQIYPLDSLREPVRLAAGLTPDKRLTEEAQQRALKALACFGERLRGLPQRRCTPVGTNTLRMAKNAKDFLTRAEAASAPPSRSSPGTRRPASSTWAWRTACRSLATGGWWSTSAAARPNSSSAAGSGQHQLESLYMGSVNWSLRFFPGGKISKSALKQAELAAPRVELETIAHEFSAGHWEAAVGSSGTAHTLGEILQMHRWSDGGLTANGLEQLRAELIKAGDVGRLEFPGLRPDRIPVLPGGFAIMSAIFSELEVPRMELATGAMRQGILYDLLGRFHHHDMRDATVAPVHETLPRGQPAGTAGRGAGAAPAAPVVP